MISRKPHMHVLPKLSESKPSMGRPQVHKTRKEIKKVKGRIQRPYFPPSPSIPHALMRHVSSSCERGSAIPAKGVHCTGQTGHPTCTANPCTTRFGRRAFQRAEGKAGGERGKVHEGARVNESEVFCHGIRRYIEIKWARSSGKDRKRNHNNSYFGPQVSTPFPRSSPVASSGSGAKCTILSRNLRVRVKKSGVRAPMFS